MNYQLSTILDEAKIKREGQLKTLNLAMLAYAGIAILLALPSAVAEVTGASLEVLFVLQLVFDFFLSPLLTLPLLAGISCLGLARAREEMIRVGLIFGHYNKIWPLFGFTVLYWLFFVLLGAGVAMITFESAGAGDTVFLVVLTVLLLAVLLLSVYVGILLCFSVLLIVDQDLGVIPAIKRSIAAVRLSGSFALLFKFYFMFFLWVILGLFTLGIAYFWIFPKYIIAYGIIYRDLFDGDTVIPKSVGDPHQGPLAKYTQAN